MRGVGASPEGWEVDGLTHHRPVGPAVPRSLRASFAGKHAPGMFSDRQKSLMGEGMGATFSAGAAIPTAQVEKNK